MGAFTTADGGAADTRPQQSLPSEGMEEQVPDAGMPEPAAEGTIRIVLADDHQVVRSGLRLLLDSEDGFEVVAEASDVESARRYVRGHHPAVLVLDLNMPGGSSLEAIPVIREESPATQIVVLTMQQEPAFAREALGAGALGYVLKEAADDELVEAVSNAAAGESYLNPRLGARIASEPPPGPPDDLSQREVEVLRLIALGHTNAEIAEQLFLSVRTVETHRSHIQQKLQALHPCRARRLRARTRPDRPGRPERLDVRAGGRAARLARLRQSPGGGWEFDEVETFAPADVGVEALAEHIEHRPVVAEDLGDEGLDSGRLGELCEPLDQDRPKSLAVQVVGDLDGDFGGLGREADRDGVPDDLPRWIERQQPQAAGARGGDLMGDLLDVDASREETKPPSFQAERREEAAELLLVGGDHHAEQNRLPAAKAHHQRVLQAVRERRLGEEWS